MANTRLLRIPDLTGVAISARLLPDGRLGGVGGLYEKTIAARFEKALPRVHTVVFAEAQRPDVEARYAGLLRDDPHAEFQVLFAATFDEMVARLGVDAETRWRPIIDCSPELARHRVFVGRLPHKETVRRFVAAPGGGYLLLVAGPGYGKSALVANLVEGDAPPIAYHFLKATGGWKSPQD